MEQINLFLQAVEGLGWIAYLSIFFFTLAEALVFVGLAVPEATLMLVLGFLLFQEFFSWQAVFLAAFFGGIAGDGISYYLGKRKYFLICGKNFFFKQKYLKRANQFMNKHGAKGVFLGKFMGPLRPMVPFIAGVCRMKIGGFLFWNILSAFCWTGLYLSLGYFFGQSLEEIGAWTQKTKNFFLALVFTFFILYFLKTIVQALGQDFFISLKLIYGNIKSWLIQSRKAQMLFFKYPKFFKFLKERF